MQASPPLLSRPLCHECSAAQKTHAPCARLHVRWRPHLPEGGARASSGRRAPGAAGEEKKERKQTRAELAFVRHQRRMKERKKGAL